MSVFPTFDLMPLLVKKPQEGRGLFLVDCFISWHLVLCWHVNTRSVSFPSQKLLDGRES